MYYDWRIGEDVVHGAGLPARGGAHGPDAEGARRVLPKPEPPGQRCIFEDASPRQLPRELEAESGVHMRRPGQETSAANGHEQQAATVVLM